MRVHSIALYRHDASGYESERAGTSRGIFFENFLPTLVRAHAAAFKGWELRIHHDQRVRQFPYFKVLDRMHRAGKLRLVDMGEAKTLCGSMLWRMLPMFDEEVEFFISRDVDSLPMHRDRSMVEEAIDAGAWAHAILDSESHSGPLMGGMTGYRPSALREVFPNVYNLESFMRLYPSCDFNAHGDDQRFLNEVVWPKVAKMTFIHQRRKDILYREAMKTKPVHPSDRVLDMVVRHIGAGYDREAAMKVIKDHHNEYWIDEMERCVFPGDRTVPWYAAGTQEFLETVIRPEWKVLEYGGGASSVWYADRVSFVVTAEGDPYYRTLIEGHKRPNLYVMDYSYKAPELYDLVAIDGTDRARLMSEAPEWVKPGGYLLLDNSDDEGYWAHVEVLKSWERKDFDDLEKPPWRTTIWRRPE